MLLGAVPSRRTFHLAWRRWPSFKDHDAHGRGVGDADEAGLVGEVVFRAFVGQGFGHEHERAVRTDEEERRCNMTGSRHAVIRVVLALRDEVGERFRPGCFGTARSFARMVCSFKRNFREMALGCEHHAEIVCASALRAIFGMFAVAAT